MDFFNIKDYGKENLKNRIRLRLKLKKTLKI